MDRMEEIIQAAEQANGCKVFFAVESGSRAWGFESPDSDYDIRAVYAMPQEWYLSLAEKQADTFAFGSGLTDGSAWELRKTLRQFAGCNISFNEWLGSDIVYVDRAGLLARLRERMPEFFNPIKAVFHYGALCRNAMETMDGDETITVKKLCYALRAASAIRWVLERKTMPPTRFLSAVKELNLSDSFSDALSALLDEKRRVDEHTRTKMNPLFTEFISGAIRDGGKRADAMPKRHEPLESMDALFREMVSYV